MDMSNAFGISEEDVKNVLLENWSRVVNRDRLTPEVLSVILTRTLDRAVVAREALRAGCDMSEQTTAAYAEIQRQLTARGEISA